MAELERELRSLAAELVWPPTPSLEARLEPRRRRPRQLAVVLAAIAVAVAVAFAVPPARSAILRFLHLGGVTIERVAVLPPAQERPLAAGLGRPVGEATARATLQAPVRLPTLDRPPRLYLAYGVMSTLLATPRPVLLSEFPSGADSYVLRKIAGASTDVVPVRVGRAPGLWIAGKEHVLLLPAASPRLAGNVLLWLVGTVTYRLEGRDLTEPLALRLANEITGTRAP